jgi:glycosyltransferase involved in cell wall biosynthesis
MATGLPVIGFADCPGTNEIIRDRQNGLLVTSSDRTEALATALDELMNDGSVRKDLGANALLFASNYSSDAILADWRRLIDRCLGPRKERST